MSADQRWERAKGLLVWAFLLAILPNTVEAFADPDGWLWSAVRYLLSALFILALGYVVAVWIARRNHARKQRRHSSMADS